MNSLFAFNHVKNLLEKKSFNNATETTLLLLKALKVPVAASSVIDSIENHPDYPSLLSISDSLRTWKVENIALQIEPEKMEELPVPFIAHTKKSGGHFVLVHSVNGSVHYADGKGKGQIKSKDEFIKDWNRVVLLADAGKEAGQKDYAAKRRKETISAVRIPAIILTCLCLILAYAGTHVASNWIAGSLLLLLKLAGCLVTGLLLWFEIDKSNPVLQQICSAGKNTNCTAVLGSKEAKLFNRISWSEIGFIYFAGSFLALTLSANLAFLAWLNLVALPYTLFSIYYQWRIAKQWCPLCLAVQVLLVLEFLASYFGYWSSSSYLLPDFSNGQLPALLTCFLLPVFFWVATKKVYLAAQEAGRYKKETARLKYNKEIFNALLLKQKAVTASHEGLGITLGNPDARHTIIKVCNPYCGPCAKAHAVIDEILEANKDVNVQIIFTATNDENDYRSKPVRHLMALHETKDALLIQKALDDWYMVEKKDYEVFASKYSLNGELQRQGDKLEAMSKWCKETGISFTPTFFVNGYQLPELYKVEDLKHLL